MIMMAKLQEFHREYNRLVSEADKFIPMPPKPKHIEPFQALRRETSRFCHGYDTKVANHLIAILYAAAGSPCPLQTPSTNSSVPATTQHSTPGSPRGRRKGR